MRCQRCEIFSTQSGSAQPSSFRARAQHSFCPHRGCRSYTHPSKLAPALACLRVSVRASDMCATRAPAHRPKTAHYNTNGPCPRVSVCVCMPPSTHIRACCVVLCPVQFWADPVRARRDAGGFGFAWARARNAHAPISVRG